ncbi:fasciclin domain-containing protein [Winogradskyella sp. DF17]|uniref:Fasciclin domain-containing protein n=1 Tax=Winogradskyella pelagia TaxID=2819984 RepID=A0ABS3T1V5_9FLAO|nr:fasciclin domain-containing protein [Winogradskyella sp. DF17]MBO3116727.1 fasciclin domain-containing protein [Winogradskyella sp. DF17]
MKIISKTLKVLTVFVFVLGFTGCSDDDDGVTAVPQPNMLETIQSDPQLTSLAAALEATGLTGAIETLDDITVLAPTNAAFATFLNGADLGSVDVDDLAAILLNHVLVGEFRAADLLQLGSGYAEGSSPNDQGLNISVYFNTSNGVRFNNAGAVIDGGADIGASNGTLHKIDGVLDLPSLLNHVENNNDFDTLNVALTATGLAGAVDTENFTILAPDNAAFTEFNPDLNDIPGVTQVLLNHVLEGSITSTMLADMGAGYSETLASGPTDFDGEDTVLNIYFEVGDNVVFNGISTVAAADVVGTNGVIHGVDTVIDLPTLLTFAGSNNALSGLVSAVGRADEGNNTINWGAALADTSLTLTVFAPADPAFDVLLDDLMLGDISEAPTDAVNGLLELHVVNGENVRSTNLGSLGGTIPTIGGNLSLNGLEITDGDGNVINILAPDLVDIQAVNGVAHAVDFVIRAAN